MKAHCRDVLIVKMLYSLPKTAGTDEEKLVETITMKEMNDQKE